MQFGGGTIGHAEGIAAGATANRVALESVLKARTKGVDLWEHGAGVLTEAARSCRPLRTALGLWKHVDFAYAATDTPDYTLEDLCCW